LSEVIADDRYCFYFGRSRRAFARSIPPSAFSYESGPAGELLKTSFKRLG
jgi:hypothetical protein